MTDIFIIDKHGQVMPKGSYGEIHIGGESVSPGYWCNQKLTNKFFKNMEIFGKKHFLYKTGDIARINQDDQLEYLGRNDHQVKIRGHRIELSEIDIALSNIKGVDKSISLIVGEGVNAKIISYIKKIPELIISEKEIILHLRSKLPNIMVPSSLVILNNLPLTNNNKIDIRKLPEPKETFAASENNYTGPSNDSEVDMQKKWEQVLNTKKISVTDSFFSLGGNSLQIPKILHMINKENKEKITIREFILNSNIRQLSDLVLQKNMR